MCVVSLVVGVVYLVWIDLFFFLSTVPPLDWPVRAVEGGGWEGEW